MREGAASRCKCVLVWRDGGECAAAGAIVRGRILDLIRCYIWQ